MGGKSKIDFYGSADFLKKLEKAGADVEKVVADALEKSAEKPKEEMLQYIRQHHFTGQTEESFTTEVKHEKGKVFLKVGFDIKKLKDIKTDGKIGIYELKSGMAEYHSVKDLDIEELKAACTLPLLGKMAKLGDRQMLDAGISKMIPIEEAIKDGCDKHIIITTKPGDYVRKPSNKAVVQIMKLRYTDCPNIAKDYEIRHRNYYIQISSIKNLVEEGKALYIYPSKSSKVSRLGGSQKELAELYELGRSDMEARKDEIFKLLGKKK